MKTIFKLRELLQQDSAALSATSTFLGSGTATLDCTDVDSLAPTQMELLFAEMPENWGFSDLRDVTLPDTLSDALANQISQWMVHQSEPDTADEWGVSELTVKRLDQVLAFLPVFQEAIASPDQRLYEVNPQVQPMEPYIYSPEVNQFIQLLYDEGFILHSFDWGIWLEEANSYQVEPERIQSADLVIIQKLMTTHIRSERFKSGHLAQLLDNGHLVALLLRLAAIQDELRASVSQSSPSGGGSVSRMMVVRGDLTQQAVDALVNSTDIAVEAEDGVSGAIFRAAGASLKEECRKLRGCAVGQAKVTAGYELPARWVIHTVGPIWQGGNHQEDELLAQCYRNSLALAALCPIQTIAFPAISTGQHQFPVERAAKIAIATIHECLQTNTTIEKVLLVCLEGEVFDAYIEALKSLGSGEEDQSPMQPQDRGFYAP